VVQRKDLVVSTMGRSFWLLDDLSPIEQIDRIDSTTPASLVTPRDAIRLRYSEDQPGEGGVKYPPPGMYFDYYLAAEPSGPVTLDVLDASGRLKRRFSSEPEPESLDPDSAWSAMARSGTPRLITKAGHHRVRWSFELPGPWDAGKRAGRNGPWVTPGRYQVRLAVGSWSAVRSFVIRPDPRVTAAGVSVLDLTQQHRTAIACRDLLSRVRRLVVRVAAARRATDDERLAGLARTLTADSGRYPTPRLAEQAAYLYAMTVSADQRMGKDVTDRLAELAKEVARAEAEFARARR
jgi:hypothetical protein